MCDTALFLTLCINIKTDTVSQRQLYVIMMDYITGLNGKSAELKPAMNPVANLCIAEEPSTKVDGMKKILNYNKRSLKCIIFPYIFI